MEIIHKADLQDFLKEVQSPVCCIINDTSDTHFARVYFNLWGNDSPGREFQFLITGYQNFVSDYEGRRESIEKGQALFQEMARELKEQGVEVGGAQIRVSGRYPVLEDEKTKDWWRDQLVNNRNNKTKY